MGGEKNNMPEELKYIHLLYVPTMACNMGCKYCYLEDNTKDIATRIRSVRNTKIYNRKIKSGKCCAI